jgi:hypothetical protein
MLIMMVTIWFNSLPLLTLFVSWFLRYSLITMITRFILKSLHHQVQRRESKAYPRAFMIQTGFALSRGTQGHAACCIVCVAVNVWSRGWTFNSSPKLRGLNSTIMMGRCTWTTWKRLIWTLKYMESGPSRWQSACLSIAAYMMQM